MLLWLHKANMSKQMLKLVYYLELNGQKNNPQDYTRRKIGTTL